MQPYPSYSMNNMPVYQQPMYQPMQNPYMDNRMAQLQAMQQNLQPQQIQKPNWGISGMFVDDFNSITANDVPMDNFGAIFVKSDGTEVQRRAWDKSGRIITMHFKAVSDVLNNQPDNLSAETTKLDTDALNKAIEGLYSKVDDLSLRIEEILKTKSATRPKKEAEVNE